jgi:hypothetical protein
MQNQLVTVNIYLPKPLLRTCQLLALQHHMSFSKLCRELLSQYSHHQKVRGKPHPSQLALTRKREAEPVWKLELTGNAKRLSDTATYVCSDNLCLVVS